MKKFGIHIRLLIAVFALICATTFALGYTGTTIVREFVQKQFSENISCLARYLALNAELGILIDDRAMLERLVANLISVENVVGVRVLDNGDMELASTQKDLQGPVRNIQIPVVIKRTQEESGAFDPGGSSTMGDHKIGSVEVSYSIANLEQLLSNMGRRFMWLSAGLAGLAGVVFYFLSRSLVKPVTQLAQAARRVARGDVELRVEPGGLPETRDLAIGFNSMLDSLKWNQDALEAAYQEIIKQNSLAEMGKFSLMVAHEVKNPLSIIKSSLDVLKSDPAVEQNETVIYYMEDEIRRLNRMIEDFLAFARPGRPCFREVDISRLLEDIIEKFEIQEISTGVEIHTAVEPHLHHERMDPDMFERAVSNILKNALEANNGKGEVWVTAQCHHAMLCVEVEDQGEGIDPEEIHKIFEPFFTTRSRGTGLGLAYVSQAVNAHNGSVSAYNRPEGGAGFRIEIPLSSSH